MNSLEILIVATLLFAVGYTAYWAGRDRGERDMYRKSRLADEKRSRTILGLKMENESLRLRVNGLEDEIQRFYPPSVWNNYKAAMSDVEAVLDQSYDES